MPRASTCAGAAFAGAAVGAAVALAIARRRARQDEEMVLVAVSGTIQDGFELRKVRDAKGMPTSSREPSPW